MQTFLITYAPVLVVLFSIITAFWSGLGTNKS